MRSVKKVKPPETSRSFIPYRLHPREQSGDRDGDDFGDDV